MRNHLHFARFVARIFETTIKPTRINLRSMGKFSHIRLNLLLLSVSTLLFLLIAEVAYRFHLHGKTVLTYAATEKSFYTYDSSSGYGYTPNTNTFTVSFYQGTPIFYQPISIGPYGNLGDGVTSWDEDDLKILAFGDSFTAYPRKNNSWADHLKSELIPAAKKSVQVMNLGREGFGVLQMVRSARITLEHRNADVAIVALIPDDFNRARVWRTAVHIDGRERVLASISDSQAPDLSRVSDVLLVEPSLDSSWCKLIVDREQEGEPFATTLHSKFRSLMMENLTVGFFSPTISFLYNKIAFRDPFFTVRRLPPIPRTRISRYEEDAAFMDDLDKILKSETPIVFVLLPAYDDIVAGTEQFEPEERLLYESLNTLIPSQFVHLLEYGEPVQDPKELFMFPYDRHPSRLGALWYAKAMAKMLRARGLVGTNAQSQQ